jgi:2-dehydropantoate 2-reductase
MAAATSSSAALSSSSLLFQEPIHIIGAGSIGLLWGTSIRSKFPTYPLTVLLRDKHKGSTTTSTPPPTTASAAAAAAIRWVQQQPQQHSPNEMGVMLHRQYQDVMLRGASTLSLPSQQPPSSSSLSSRMDSTTSTIVSIPFDCINHDQQQPVKVDEKIANTIPTSLLSLSSSSSSQRIQNLIVTTKSYQALDAVKSVLPRLMMMAPTSTSIPMIDNSDNGQDGGSTSTSSDNNNNSYPIDSYSSSKVIVLCNGALSVRDELQKVLHDASTRYTEQLSQQQQQQYIIPYCSLVLATTTHGAYREDTYIVAEDYGLATTSTTTTTTTDPIVQQRVIHAGYGTTFIEESSSSSSSTTTPTRYGGDTNSNNSNVGDGERHYGRMMAGLWNEGGLNCIVLPSNEMELLLWKKLAANCVINPLSAIYHCTNGELLLEPTFPELQNDIITEVAAVMTRTMEQQQPHQDIENFSNNSDRGLLSSQSSLLSPSSQEITTTKLLREFVMQVIQDTKDNKSSMYQDITKGQKTEIHHLNGYIVRKGRELGLECPANEYLCDRIRELEASNSQRQPRQE